MAKRTIPVIMHNIDLEIHLGTEDDSVNIEQIDEILQNLNTLTDSIGPNIQVERLKLLLANAIRVERLEIKTHGQSNNSNGKQAIQVQAQKQNSRRADSLPEISYHRHKLQTWPHAGKSVEELLREIGEDGFRYLASMPDTHPRDKAAMINYLKNDEIPF